MAKFGVRFTLAQLEGLMEQFLGEAGFKMEAFLAKNFRKYGDKYEIKRVM